MKYKNVYVAASSQHVGKTTTTLGLISSFIRKELNVGYCKPVGQKFLALNNLFVDKDTLLFADLIDFDIIPEVHSPVILPSHVIREILSHPETNNFEDKVIQARNSLNDMHDLVIYEGTGHPGVGSVVGLSNARVAKMLNAGVVMVVEGGIGSTIDMLNMTTALFREENVPIIGVIINKVRKDKLDMVTEYLSLWLERQGIPLIGIIPYDPLLGYPLLSSINYAIGGDVLMNEDMLTNRVENMLAGTLVDLKELKTFKNLLLITGYRTLKRAIKKVDSFSRIKKIKECPLSGIVVTGEGEIDPTSEYYIKKHKVPLIHTNFETYGVVLKISRIEVKINRRTPWKIARAIELVEENLDLDLLLKEVPDNTLVG